MYVVGWVHNMACGNYPRSLKPADLPIQCTKLLCHCKWFRLKFSKAVNASDCGAQVMDFI